LYLTVVCDPDRRGCCGWGEDRTEDAVKTVFTEEMGRPAVRDAAGGLHGHVGAIPNLVRQHAPNAQILFDRFHIVKHLDEAVDTVRRELGIP
jgi:transposase